MSPMSPRLLRPRATGFSPTQIAGLAAWWDASDSTTMFDATSGGSLVAANGAVARWEDKSGNGRHATQSTSNNRPLRTVAAHGGKDVLRFDGSNDSLSIASSTATFKFLHSADSTVFAVFKSGTTANPGHAGYAVFATNNFSSTETGAVLSTADNNPTTNNDALEWFLSRGSTGNWNVYSANNNYFASNVLGMVSLVSKPADATSGNRVALRKNGGSLSTANSPSGSSGVSTGDATHSLAIGSHGNQTSGLLNGDIAEIIIYNSALSAAEIQKLEGYLAWKYGLQATLPYDHPYAASFPGYGTQATPTDADALAYLSAVRTADGGTGVEVGVANAVDGFVKGCKADGIWDSIKASCILAGARTLSGALVPLAGTAPTNNNFVAADYNRKTGLLGDGTTKYLNSNRLDAADSLNDVHLSVYVSAVSSLLRMYAGTQSHYIYRDNADVILASRNATAVIGSSGSLTGLYGHSRAASNSFASRVGGASNTHVAATSSVMNTNVYVFARNLSNANNSTSNARLAFYSIGSSLDLALLDTRITRLVNESQYHLNTGLSGASYSTETLAYINAGYAAGGTLA